MNTLLPELRNLIINAVSSIDVNVALYDEAYLTASSMIALSATCKQFNVECRDSIKHMMCSYSDKYIELIWGDFDELLTVVKNSRVYGITNLEAVLRVFDFNYDHCIYMYAHVNTNQLTNNFMSTFIIKYNQCCEESEEFKTRSAYIRRHIDHLAYMLK